MAFPLAPLIIFAALIALVLLSRKYKNEPTDDSDCITLPVDIPLAMKPSPLLDTSPNYIWEHVYLGDQRDAFDLKHLKELKIDYILNVSDVFGDTVHFYYENAPYIQYYGMPIYDVPEFPIEHYFGRAITIIDQARREHKNILVHCQAGKSRSSTIVAAYLMAHSNMTCDEALSFVRKRRPIIRPNPGFYKSLYAIKK